MTTEAERGIQPSRERACENAAEERSHDFFPVGVPGGSLICCRKCGEVRELQMPTTGQSMQVSEKVAAIGRKQQ